MPVNLSAPQSVELHPVPGVRLGIAEAGIRKAGRKDLTVILLDEGSGIAGVFTRNRFCAAPVQVCREHLSARTDIRALVINTGNANAGTGSDGLDRARANRSVFPARMPFFVGLFHVLQGDVGVDFGGLKIGMAQHFLHSAQICTPGQQMGGEVVAQRVG